MMQTGRALCARCTWWAKKKEKEASPPVIGEALWSGALSESPESS